MDNTKEQPNAQRGPQTSSPQVIEALSPMITDERRARIEAILDRRTYNLTVVLEDLYDIGNVSAILRSADAFGLQRVNLVLNSPRYKVDRKIALGSHKWLDFHRYHDPVACVRELQGQGYQVLATHLTEEASTLSDVDFSKPTALVFGNEHAGVSPELVQACDGCVVIPMVGFAQSFNVSVAAAIAMYHARLDRDRRLGPQGDLSDEQKQALRARFYRRCVRNSDLLLTRMLS